MKNKTQQRAAILRVIKSTKSHPTTQWIYEQARKEVPGIGLATVYRNLRLLKEKGEVTEVHTTQGIARYDGITASHDHFICDDCGKIIDIQPVLKISLDYHLSAATGFEVTRHHLEMHGICPDCRKYVKNSSA